MRRGEAARRNEILGQGPILMTIQTKERLEEELRSVNQTLVDKTKSLGGTQESAQDWHDNAAYDHLQEELAVLEDRQLRISVALREPKIIEPRRETDIVGIGNTVFVRYQGETENEAFTILGPYDSKTHPSWISYESALGNALIGQLSGSNVELPNGTSVTLVRILPGDF